MENNKPLLSVCLITYNHEKFIEQAIESVLMQKINFNWEFIIADDYSTDNTRAIIKKYADKYPNLIKLILQEKNVGAARNWLDLIYSPIGKYTAFFEGDDYWTDPYKLQKQVDFLEANDDYVICFHKVMIRNGEELVEDFITHVPKGKDSFTIMDLAKGNFIHTPSVVFRNNLIKLPEWFLESPIGDYPLYMLLSFHGKIKLLEDTMAVYRYNVGVWSGMDRMPMLLKWFKMLNLLKTDIPKEIIYEIYQFQDKNIFLEIENIWVDLKKEKESILKSKDYQLGKLLLSPLRWLRKISKHLF